MGDWELAAPLSSLGSQEGARIHVRVKGRYISCVFKGSSRERR